MENKTQLASSSSSSSKSSSSSSSTFDQLFGPKTSTPSSSAGIFSSIFAPPSSTGSSGNVHSMGHNANRQYTEEAAEPSYLSSSIYYGGQENYSPRTKTNDHQSHSRNNNSTLKKDGKEDDSSNGSNGASRGNWWQGSLYY